MRPTHWQSTRTRTDVGRRRSVHRSEGAIEADAEHAARAAAGPLVLSEGQLLDNVDSDGTGHFAELSTPRRADANG